MAVNTEYLGRRYPGTEVYRVSHEKIREFAQALGAADPLHVDREAARAAGYPDVVAPPTFAVVIAQRAEAAYVRDPGAGVDFSRVVHAEESFVHHRPITAGDTLSTEVVVDAIRRRPGLTFVTTRCEIADAAGEPVSTVTSVLAVREA